MSYLYRPEFNKDNTYISDWFFVQAKKLFKIMIMDQSKLLKVGIALGRISMADSENVFIDIGRFLYWKLEGFVCRL